MHNILNKTTVIWGLLVAWLLVVNPGKLPIFLLAVPFILIYVGIFCTVRRFQGAVKPESSSKQKMHAHMVAIVVVLLLALQSLNQLTWQDGITVGVFAVLVSFYLRRNIFITKQ